ncbi:MAG: hypothetical protein ACRECW_12275 [Phyllobacterium sp.]
MPQYVALGLAVVVLAACSETAPSPKIAATPPRPPVDASPITGNWCSPDGGRFSISQTRFDSRESNCAITGLNNFEGTFTTSLSCESEGQTTSENVTISPVGNGLHITFLSKGGRRAIVSPC